MISCSSDHAPNDETTDEQEPSITVNKLDIITQYANDTLTFSIDTDLPDSIPLWVTVYRRISSPNFVNNRGEITYFDAAATVQKWKVPQEIDVSKSIFEAKGKTLTIESISDELIVDIRDNRPRSAIKLTGKAIKENEGLGDVFVNNPFSLDIPLQ